MVGFDVRVHVGSMFADVHAVRTPKARRFAALVIKMAVQATVPLVRFATLGALEIAARINVRVLVLVSALAPKPWVPHDRVF